MTRVLTDLHHHALAESELMLFEDRFGWFTYFPAGMEWFDEDIWQFEKAWHGDKVARQYLEGWWDDAELKNGIYIRKDPRHPWRTQHGVTLAAAREMDWDYVISSLPHNDVGLHGFAKEHGAKFGVQVGNNLQDSDWTRAEFILSSSTLPGLGLEAAGKVSTYRGIPTVVYHQEFSLDTFRFEYPPANRREIASWVNCFGEGPSYPDFLKFARQYADEFDFKVYGALGSAKADEFTDAGADVSFVPDVADLMRAARVGWHSKHWSDGFGHTIHNWFAIGRPVVGYARYYADKLAGPLWVEGETSFDIEGLSEADLAALLRRLCEDDEYHERICTASAARFREIVDFDGEAEAIRMMLS